jgi:hypothetical protein
VQVSKFHIRIYPVISPFFDPIIVVITLVLNTYNLWNKNLYWTSSIVSFLFRKLALLPSSCKSVKRTLFASFRSSRVLFRII